MAAKQVTGNTCMKSIVDQDIFTAKQVKPARSHDQVQVAGFLAN